VGWTRGKWWQREMVSRNGRTRKGLYHSLLRKSFPPRGCHSARSFPRDGKPASICMFFVHHAGALPHDPPTKRPFISRALVPEGDGREKTPTQDRWGGTWQLSRDRRRPIVPLSSRLVATIERTVSEYNPKRCKASISSGSPSQKTGILGPTRWFLVVPEVLSCKMRCVLAG
jgi:hypothetical protein